MITTIFYVVAALLVLVLLTRNSRGRRAGTGGFSFSVPSLIGRGSMPNTTIIWMATGAVLFLVIGLVWNFVLAITFAIFAGFIWMKWKKADGAGFMMVAGLAMLAIWWLGPAHVTSVGQQIGAGVSGAEAPPPPPLSDAEQAARLQRAQQDAEVAATENRATARVYATNTYTEKVFGWLDPISIPPRGESIEVVRHSGTAICWDSLPSGVTWWTRSEAPDSWIEGAQENVWRLRFHNTSGVQQDFRVRRVERSSC